MSIDDLAESPALAIISFFKKMIDSHVHIDFGGIESELELYVKKAQERNIEEFTITNHVIFPIPSPDYLIKGKKVFLRKDLSFLKCSLTAPDLKRYIATVKMKRPDVCLGAEIDYSERYENELRMFIGLLPNFDLVLGALHFLDGHCISRKVEMENFSNEVPIVSIYKKYFTKLRGLVKSRLFDVVSHVDLIRKHSEHVSFNDYALEIDTLINDLLENDVGIEVNTSGYAFINDSYPSIEFLSLCKEKGLEKITIGSDAHTAEKLGERLEKAVEKLKKVGYDKIVKFKNRKPDYIPI